VISIPKREMVPPSGPIEKGITYIVRPRMQPLNAWASVAFISAGSAQLLVGPASDSLAEQMKVRDSTRATSDGSERARKLLGRFSGFNLMKVPESTISWFNRSRSSTEPSHQWMASGLVSSATPVTQVTRDSGASAGAVAAMVAASTVIILLVRSRVVARQVGRSLSDYPALPALVLEGVPGTRLDAPERVE